MKHELKVIMGATSAETMVYVGDEAIGLIQDIKFRASTEQHLTEIEITFPNLMSEAIDPSYKLNNSLIGTLHHYIDLLKLVPHVKVILKEIDFTRP